MRAGIIATVLLAALALCVYFAMIPREAYAHGYGLTLSATTSAYYIDVDYSDLSVHARESGRFDIKLFTDPERTKAVDFSQVFARISRVSDLQEGDTIFSGWLIKSAFGPTGFSIELPEPGMYTLSVRFAKGDKTIEAVELPFTVLEARADPSSHRYGIWIVAGLALMCLIALIRFSITRRRR